MPPALAASLAFSAAALTFGAFAQDITVDGDVSEWPEGTYAAADDVWLYARFEAKREITLHAAPFSSVIEIDADGSTKTGINADGMGTDLVIEFTPTRLEGERRWGPRITAFEGGAPVEILSMNIDLHAAPTASGRWFEVRVRRDLLDDVLKADVASAKTARIRVSSPPGVLSAPEAGTVYTAKLPALGKPLVDAAVPTAPAGAVRIMSWNVLWGSPKEDPRGFARILESTKPDIVLIQEWGRDGITPEAIDAWFEQHASWAGSDSDESAWSVTKPLEVWGAAVVTRHELVATGPDEVFADGTRWTFPTRLASGAISIDNGPTLAVGSVHLKCCGHVGSQEDHRRLVEAAAINDALQQLAQDSGADHIILGGDFNIDGTLAVLDVATMGLDADNTRLEYATPAVLGDDALYTFGRPGMNTERKRLDYILYPDAASKVVNAFVLDTARLTDSALKASGLNREDSAASDHLPIIVDLVFNNEG